MMLFVFIGWTFTSFACHFCAKRFVSESSMIMPGMEFSVIVLTVLQVFFYKQVASFSDEHSKDALVHKIVIITSHTCATLATNWSMALTHAASTFAIKLMEPLTSAVLQRLIMKVKISFLQWISVPAVVSGAMIFANEKDTGNLTFSKGMVLAFLSNVCLSLRNVYMKRNHLSNATFKVTNIRLTSGIFIFGTIGALILYNLVEIELMPIGIPKTLALLVGSSLFHAIYSYISTVIILRHFAIITHAFGNIFKRLAVLGLLYMTGSRTASFSNFLGLSLCMAGLAIYTFSKDEENNNNQSDKESKIFFAPMMKSKRLVFALFTVIIILLPLYQLNGVHEMLGMTNHDIKYTHGENFKREWLLQKTNMSLIEPITFNIKDFYSKDLTISPDEANKLSPLLTKRQDVIEEAQRIHNTVFKTLLSGYKYAMLFDYSISENKGDSAITVGEVLLLRKLDVKIVFTCSALCSNYHLDLAQNISKNYTTKDLVILLHGGGNVVGYIFSDYVRSLEINRFMNFNIIMFPQSVSIYESDSHLMFCKKTYNSYPNLTFVWRDQTSLNIGRMLFPKVRSLLSPDMAYQIGLVNRYMTPTFDILWIKRDDKESPGYRIPEIPKRIRMHISDWLNWTSPLGESKMEDAFLRTTNGMMFLQRGRVVITDRLHGHILSTLLNIPHVYIDNKQNKISNYHNTWTAGLENVVLAHSSDDAVVKAMKLLAELDKVLPKIKGYF